MKYTTGLVLVKIDTKNRNSIQKQGIVQKVLYGVDRHGHRYAEVKVIDKYTGKVTEEDKLYRIDRLVKV